MILSEKVTGIVRSFSANWKKSIDAINKEILQSFTNFKNGTNILQVRYTGIPFLFPVFYMWESLIKVATSCKQSVQILHLRS